MGLNYGFDKVGFLQAVKVNTKVKGTVVLVCLLEKRPNEFLLTWNVTVEIESIEKPALTAQ